MRALAAFALLWCSACFPFADALGRCEDAGRCPAGAGGGGGGGAGGGGATGDGGFTVGPAYCSPDGICWGGCDGAKVTE